ncbi:MAG: glycosyltransferase family 2 protein [Dechloromonas sp.]|nr:glycosyltransferase family 2 protein [Dechloromonas sp.]
MTPPSLPPVTLLLLCYNQQDTIAEALAGALAQDYPNLEIVISDDASRDATVEQIEPCLRDYAGPHRIKLLRNAENLGIGGNIDQAVRQSNGELIFIAGGDDVSLPNRVSTVVDFWRAHDGKPDLIGAYLFDMDQTGNILGTIRIGTLEDYRTLDDWSRSPPHVIGAAQAWTRRLFDRFGGLPKGAVGEDMVMAFRAIGLATAITLPVPLVNYRRGGLTSKRKALSTDAVIRGLTRKINSSKTELSCMLDDARKLGASAATLATLTLKLDKEKFIEAMFAASGTGEKIRICLRYGQLPGDFRLRILTYAAAPWLLAPFFFLKRLRYRSAAGS